MTIKIYLLNSENELYFVRTLKSLTSKGFYYG